MSVARVRVRVARGGLCICEKGRDVLNLHAYIQTKLQSWPIGIILYYYIVVL